MESSPFAALYQTFLERKKYLKKSSKKEVEKLVSSSYVASLLSGGTKKINRKIIEEAYEVTEAACDKPFKKNELIHELADLWFHQMVLMFDKNIKLEEIEQELTRRMGQSGIDEKNNRNK